MGRHYLFSHLFTKFTSKKRTMSVNPFTPVMTSEQASMTAEEARKKSREYQDKLQTERDHSFFVEAMTSIQRQAKLGDMQAEMPDSWRPSDRVINALRKLGYTMSTVDRTVTRSSYIDDYSVTLPVWVINWKE